MNSINFKDHIRVVIGFPQPGVRFKDITTLLKNGTVYKQSIEQMATMVKHLPIDLIAGPEARGFVIGAPLAYELGVGFVPIRKSGKLPSETVEANYNLEYGQDKLAMHYDAISPGQHVLIADDLLATGGTIAATVGLIEQLGGIVVGAVFLIELSYLHGHKKFADINTYSLVQYE